MYTHGCRLVQFTYSSTNIKVTVIYLQECNIFKCVSARDYPVIMEMISLSIVATDLSSALQKWPTFSNLVDTKQFSWYNSEHKSVFR